MSKLILLIDNHEIVRIGLRSILHATDLLIAKEVADSRAAISCLAEGHFDLVVVDPKLPDGDGFAMIKEMKSMRPTQSMALFSDLGSQPLIYHAILMGMNGFVSKLAPSDVIIDSFQRLAHGESLWTQDEVRRSNRIEINHKILETNTGVPLTKRETAVLEKLASGMTNQDIAVALGISYETVKEHVQHILRKIGVSDRTQAAVWAVKHDLV